MKAFFRKHRFKIVISLLVIVFLYVSFYMLWVHVPYASHKNELTSIQETLCKKYNYTYDDYFNEYHGQKIYYVMKAKKKKKVNYVVFDDKNKIVDKYEGKAVSKASVKNAFEKKYKHKVTHIEMGYENKKIVYCVTYQGKDSLLYAFYEIETGDFVKAYKL